MVLIKVQVWWGLYTLNKQVESYEQLIQRFTNRTMQLSSRNQELQSAYDEYVKNQNDLKRLEGSMQAIQYVAYGKMPGDGNHDKFKDHLPRGTDVHGSNLQQRKSGV